MIKVLNRFTGSVLLEVERLTGAYLTGADLSRANLAGANLAGADLTGADLTGACLTGANMTGANLSRAYLTGANMIGADLTGANLTGANLTGADLIDANLTGADLRRADLSSQWVVQGGVRSDGHAFFLQRLTGDDQPMVKAGCRLFTLEEAKAHWTETRGGTPLGNETFAIIDGMVAVAKARGLL
jgi:hypothetical protein